MNRQGAKQVPNTDAISAVLRRAAESGDVPGVAAAAATANGPFFEAGFGSRDLATGAPMTAETFVCIASMT
jgi:CubicO group peptidase (beta-lactamase class C family)